MTITRQNELNRIRAEVSRLELHGRDAVLALTLDELDAAFNGCGPDFLPVRVVTVGYMYDRVSGQFFGNAGTGAFIIGPDKTT